MKIVISLIVASVRRVITLSLKPPDLEYKAASAVSILSPTSSTLSPASSICTLQRISTSLTYCKHHDVLQCRLCFLPRRHRPRCARWYSLALEVLTLATMKLFKTLPTMRISTALGEKILFVPCGSKYP
ncbi:hypothetical protein BGY98DRAFT_431298 [Russula aff. rugulosa BPL654]|nr:hypothetical protein BGY98DRAFT_431298 [Russula aff. rugulosa BPL654]